MASPYIIWIAYSVCTTLYDFAPFVALQVPLKKTFDNLVANQEGNEWRGSLPCAQLSPCISVGMMETSKPDSLDIFASSIEMNGESRAHAQQPLHSFLD